MDANQLHELATNAELNHWPPHLGVTTDAEKIEYLAERLKEAAGLICSHDEELEAAEQHGESLADNILALEQQVEHLTDKNEELKAKVEELKAKLA